MVTTYRETVYATTADNIYDPIQRLSMFNKDFNEYYTFTGWSVEDRPVTFADNETLLVSAQFDKKTFEVSLNIAALYNNKGVKLLDEQNCTIEVMPGDMPSFLGEYRGVAGYRAYLDDGTYIGQKLPAVYEPTTYSASFIRETDYKITIYDANNNILLETIAGYGDNMEHLLEREEIASYVPEYPGTLRDPYVAHFVGWVN